MNNNTLTVSSPAGLRYTRHTGPCATAYFSTLEDAAEFHAEATAEFSRNGKTCKGRATLPMIEPNGTYAVVYFTQDIVISKKAG